jgi:hypothetical protein
MFIYILYYGSTKEKTNTFVIDSVSHLRYIASILPIILVSVVVDRGFETRSGQCKDYEIYLLFVVACM